MGKDYFVAKDEHLAFIAKQFGFSSIDPIWNHPANAELKSLRGNPNILLEGDHLVIPDRETRVESVATDQRHRFVAAGSLLELHVKVQDQGFTPIRGAAILTTESSTTPMVQTGDIFQIPVQVTDAKAS